MKVVAPILAAFLALLGVVFVAGNQGVALRLVVGVALLASAVALVWASRARPQRSEVVQRIELTGDVHAEALTCERCGGSLSKESVEVRAGAVFVTCPYCEAAYQLEEEPKW